MVHAALPPVLRYLGGHSSPAFDGYALPVASALATTPGVLKDAGGDFNLTEVLRELEEEMQLAAANLEYEWAALLREVAVPATNSL